MLIYLLKMIACSAAFYGLYVLLFKNEKMFVFNRFYLLGSLLLSFFIPFITITVDAPVMPSTVMTLNERVVVESQVPSVSEVSLGSYVIYVAMLISVIVSSVLLMRLVLNYLKLKRVAKHGQQLYIDHVQVVLLDQPLTPHSFLNTIFLNREEYDSGRVEEEVIQHEIAHIQQKHSWDIFLIECLQAFTWFNPVIYLYKRSIKINHELLADAAVVKQLDNMRGYQYILLKRAGAQPSLALASSFDFFITKKRIIMLQKKANPVMAGLKATVSLPLLALLVVVFSERVYAQVENPQIDIISVKSVKQTSPPPKDVESTVVSYSKDGKRTQVEINYNDGRKIAEDISTQEKAEAFEKKYGIELPPVPPTSTQELSAQSGATEAEMKEYINIMKENEREKGGKKVYLKFSRQQQQRISELLGKMTVKQRESVSNFPPRLLPPGPPPAINKSGIETVRVTAPNGKPEEATIIFKNGNVAKGDVSTPEKAKAFEEKYNVKLPPPPPPAPPTSKKKAVAPPPLPAPAVTKVTMPLPPSAPLPPKKMKIAQPLTPPPPPKIEVKKFAPPKIVEDKETTRENTPGERNKKISVLYDSGPGKGATNQELQEYIQLVDRMKAAIGNNDNRTITSMWNEYSKAHWIYSAMDKEQRAKYAKGFNELAMLSNKKAEAIRQSGPKPN